MDDLHGKHRSRIKNKYLQYGTDNMCEHEILEMLLFYCVPRKDTNGLAHRLINEFGSIAGIFDAPVSRLQSFGLTTHQICFLKFIPDVTRTYMDSKADQGKTTQFDMSSENLKKFFATKFIGRTEECLYMLLLSPKKKKLYCGAVSKGDINATDVPVRKIVELALRYKAKYAILAHNHPSGLAIPSQADLVTTRNICQTFYNVGIQLIDHVIVSDTDQLPLSGSEYDNGLFLPIYI